MSFSDLQCMQLLAQNTFKMFVRGPESVITMATIGGKCPSKNPQGRHITKDEKSRNYGWLLSVHWKIQAEE